MLQCAQETDSRHSLLVCDAHGYFISVLPYRGICSNGILKNVAKPEAMPMHTCYTARACDSIAELS